MAVTDSQKVDYLWKKVGYAATKTDTDTNKSAPNESIPSPLQVRGDKIMAESDLIPGVIPTSNASPVTVYVTSAPVECTNDATASANRTWLTNLTDWISPEFGSTYQAKVYIHTSGFPANAASAGTQVFATGSGNNDEWFFDYQSGVVHFIGTNLPNGVSFTGKSVYVSGARYTGTFGIPTTFSNLTLGNLLINGDTISSVNANGDIILNAPGTGVVQITGGDALGLPSGNSISRPGSPDPGYIRFNTDSATLEYWDGNSWTYPGAATITSETINPDGVNDTYTLSSEASADGLLVSINGTMQQPFVAYSMSGNDITFVETPQDTDIIEVRHIAAGAVSVSSLSYGPETTVQLTAGNINVTGNVLPSANVTYSLGSPDKQWKDLYVSANTIYIGGTAVTVSNGSLSVGGGAVGLVYSNSNVASYLTTYSGNVTASYVTANVFVGDQFNYSNGVSILDGVISLVTSNAAIQAGLITELSSNAAVQSGLISAAVTAAGETTANANTAMKGYVDGQLSTLTSNAAVQAGLIADNTTAITTANTAMKGYVDGQVSTLTSNAAVQAGLITDTNTAITTANTALKGYVDAINSTLTANAAVQAGNIATIQGTYAQLAGATFTGALAAPNISLTTALAISSGGTGGTSSSTALNNLLPSGEVSGYVLKTSGEGSYYWSAETGGGSTVGTSISTSRNYFTANSGQTEYTGLSYTPGAGQLRVYINGVRQFDSAYTETNSSAFTLSTGVTSGTVVLAEVDAYTDYNVYANATYSTPVGSISSTTVQDAIAELDTEKAALSGANFTGNVSTTGNLRVTDTTQSTGEGTGALVVSGGASFGGNVYISGNLQVAGTETIFNANNLNIADSLIYLADDNTGDVLDIGIVSSFTNPGYQHTGFVRDATDGVWKLFANVVTEPTTTVDFTNAQYSNLRIGNLTSISATLSGNLGVASVNATNLYGTVRTAAQTNITSVGTLTALTVSGAPVPNANVSVNLGSTSAWWSTFYANTHVGRTATFTGNITAGNISATNLSGAITSAQVTTALGFTPYNSTNPSSYIALGAISVGTAAPAAGSGALAYNNTSGVFTYTPPSISSLLSAGTTASNVQFASFGVGTAASNTAGEIRATNNITAYYSSDARLKENVRDIPNALDKVTAIGGKLFAWTDDYIASHGGVDAYFLPKESFGVIAQDVEQVFPEAVRTRDDGYLAVDYEKMCALAFQAIKELQQQVQLLEQQIKDK